jgi:hypothetical protein
MSFKRIALVQGPQVNRDMMPFQPDPEQELPQQGVQGRKASGDSMQSIATMSLLDALKRFPFYCDLQESDILMLPGPMLDDVTVIFYHSRNKVCGCFVYQEGEDFIEAEPPTRAWQIMKEAPPEVGELVSALLRGDPVQVSVRVKGAFEV